VRSSRTRAASPLRGKRWSWHGNVSAPVRPASQPGGNTSASRGSTTSAFLSSISSRGPTTSHALCSSGTSGVRSRSVDVPVGGQCLDTNTLLRIYAGCARREISRRFLPNSCIASTAITLDVLRHYGRIGSPWEVCLTFSSDAIHLELGCYPPVVPRTVGGHLVCLVDDCLVDASFGQITDANPTVQGPPVFVGELLPRGAPLQSIYEFHTPFGRVRYESRAMSLDYRTSPDWGPSPERDVVKAAILAQIEGFCRLKRLGSPRGT
jgi:hypothetical protein